jgi:hypothetical protein
MKVGPALNASATFSASVASRRPVAVWADAAAVAVMLARVNIAMSFKIEFMIEISTGE